MDCGAQYISAVHLLQGLFVTHYMTHDCSVLDQTLSVTKLFTQFWKLRCKIMINIEKVVTLHNSRHIQLLQKAELNIWYLHISTSSMVSWYKCFKRLHASLTLIIMIITSRNYNCDKVKFICSELSFFTILWDLVIRQRQAQTEKFCLIKIMRQQMWKWLVVFLGMFF